jgi:hypothetical protein
MQADKYNFSIYDFALAKKESRIKMLKTHLTEGYFLIWCSAVTINKSIPIFWLLELRCLRSLPWWKNNITHRRHEVSSNKSSTNWQHKHKDVASPANQEPRSIPVNGWAAEQQIWQWEYMVETLTSNWLEKLPCKDTEWWGNRWIKQTNIRKVWTRCYQSYMFIQGRHPEYEDHSL